MSKLKILDKKSEQSINSEREFLSKLNNPFIVNMHYAFQDSENLYLVMDLMSGGDLRYHISRHKTFSEEQTRFFICGIIIALEYIHGNNVIHRDIKPENLVLDNKGYIRLTDFGIAKENLPDNSSETSGTPGYMSPEVMNSLNHSFPVDFFALGVIGYEFMKGDRPYKGKNRNEIKEQMEKQININSDIISEGWSKESADFINKLLILEPENRIGYKGINELKEHLWLRYYPWDMLYKKQLPSPFIPESDDNFDKIYCESLEEITKETQARYDKILLDEKFKEVFDKFYYNIDEINFDRNESMIKSKPKTKIETKVEKIININKNKTDKIKDYKSDKNRNILIQKKKKLNSMEMNLNENVVGKYGLHKKSGSSLNYDYKNYSHNINNISENISNNVIYINFNINNPNITGDLYKNYQDNNSKSEKATKSVKNKPKNNYYQNKFITNKSLIQQIGFNIDKLIGPIHSIKNIKNSGIKKNKLTKRIENNNKKISIFEIYNKSKKRKKFLFPNNNTTLFESPFDNQLRLSDKISFRKNKNSLINSKNEMNIFDSKNKTERESKNKNGKIKIKHSLNKYNYNNYLTNSMNLSNININNNPLTKSFLNYNSIYDKTNFTHNISSNPFKPCTYKDKSIKTSRYHSNRNNSKINELSLTTSKTYLNQNNASTSKKRENNIKPKNIYLNINRLYKNTKFKSNDITSILIPKTREKNISFDNFKNDVLIDTINLIKSKNETSNVLNKSNNFIINNQKNKKVSENQKINLSQKGKNFAFSNNYKLFTNNDRYNKNQNKYNNFQTNNLSISSVSINNYKNKEISKTNINVNNFKKLCKGSNIKNNNTNVKNNKISKRNKILGNDNKIIFPYKKKHNN